MTEQETQQKVEVKVGSWLADGTFTGEVVRFSGEDLGGYTDYSDARSKDDRGTTYTLYRLPNGNYRIHREEWSRWQGEGDHANLLPNSWEEFDPDQDDPYYFIEHSREEGRKYGSYTEAEARKRWPELFAAVGIPNVRDLDEE